MPYYCEPIQRTANHRSRSRDRSDNWRDRLTQLRALGLQVITCYIPWCHHQLDAVSQPDFTEATQPNRNVTGFLQLYKDLDLAVLVKASPFIHAENHYGGLPDWTCPVNNPKIEPVGIRSFLFSYSQCCCWRRLAGLPG